MSLGPVRRPATNTAQGILRILGFACVVLTWLPLSFVDRPDARVLARTGEIQTIDRVGAEAVWALQVPLQKAQLHQFRSSGDPGWLREDSRVDHGEPAGLVLQRPTRFVAPRRMASAPVGLANTWQFVCRTAHHPRAPCRA